MAYRVLEYGAAGDGRQNDAQAIQAVIDRCSAQGGGRVILEGGHTFVCGSLILRENVELYIETGAVLKASEDLKDYANFDDLNTPAAHERLTVPTFENCEYDGKPKQYFIYAKDADHVTISGGGMIDGSEQIYYGEIREDHIDGAWYPRIPLLFLEHCRHLVIRDVTLRRSGFWTTHLVGCEEVSICGVHILNNRKMANCDGIDPDHCKHVRISNCHIEAADDCIVMKTTEAYQKYGDCEDIIISGCTLQSTSAAIKIGTESCNDFRNIVIENCIISDSNRGISFQLRDQGNISDVMISNCVIRTRQASACWWGCGEPVNIASIDRKKEIPSGKISGILLSNLRCEGEGSIYLAGKPDQPIEDLTLQNIRHVLVKNSEYPVKGYDFRPCAGPDFEERRISGLHIRNARQLYTANVRVRVDESMKSFVDQEIRLENCQEAGN